MRGQFSFPYFDPGHSVGTKPCSGPLCVKQLDLRVLKDLATEVNLLKAKPNKQNGRFQGFSEMGVRHWVVLPHGLGLGEELAN